MRDLCARSTAWILVSQACLLSAVAQPYYSFSQASEPYQEIASGTTATFFGPFAPITIVDGDVFPITGSPFLFGGDHQLWILDGGALNIDTEPENTVFLSALFRGFGGLVTLDATSSVKYALTGPAGDKKLTVQWKNMRPADGLVDHFVNFQIIMYQATGILELRYGPHNDGDATYSANTGPNAGFYFADYNTTVLYDRLWLAGDPVAPTLSSALIPSFTGLTSVPADGTVYRFSPTWLTGIAVPHNADHSPLQVAWVDDNSRILLQFSDHGGAGSITVRDLQGRVLSTTRRNSDRMILPMGPLPNAVYIIEYRTDHGDIQVLRVVG